tara:strand:+ start:217 stop:456 length:240 start_codon:yes stop_codon:yes gene_type:complete
MMTNLKTHLKITGSDHRNNGQSDFCYDHQAACGYQRENVSRKIFLVDCRLCQRSDEYRQIRKTYAERARDGRANKKRIE